jgi:hypothetical protein
MWFSKLAYKTRPKGEAKNKANLANLKKLNNIF